MKKTMYTYEGRLKAIDLYFIYDSYAAVINEFGFPSRKSLFIANS